MFSNRKKKQNNVPFQKKTRMARMTIDPQLME